MLLSHIIDHGLWVLLLQFDLDLFRMLELGGVESVVGVLTVVC